MITFAILMGCWLAAGYLALVDNRPRWVEPYVAWWSGPTQVHMIAATWGGVSFESRQLPWNPSVWPPVRSAYEPEPDLAVEPLDGTTMVINMSRSLFPDASLLGLAKGGWEAQVGTGGRSGATSGNYVSVPFWFLFLVFGAMPARALVRHVRTRRFARRGMCKVCGYHLRASSQRCPECGAVRPVSVLARLFMAGHALPRRWPKRSRKNVVINPSATLPFPVP